MWSECLLFVVYDKCLTCLSLASCSLAGLTLTPADAHEVAGRMQGSSGFLCKMTFNGDHEDSKPVTVEKGMHELDCSGANLQASGAIILAAWIQHM